MQPPSPYYPRYPTTMIPSNVSPYAQAPPPPSYVYQQYPTYPPVAYTHSYSPLVHTAAPPAYGASRNPQPYPNQAASEREAFYRKLHAFRDALGEPIQRLPTLGFKELDLWVLYKEVVKRHGIDAVIAKKQWKEVAEALQLPSSCTDSGFRLRLHYKKYLEAFERKFYKPPVDVEVRERKKKRSSAGSESAETEVAVGEESVGSSDKGADAAAERRSPVPKRKRRASVKREKKKESPESVESTAVSAEVAPVRADASTRCDASDRKDVAERKEDVEMVDGSSLSAGPGEEKLRRAVNCADSVGIDSNATVSVEPEVVRSASPMPGERVGVVMRAGKAERDAAHALVEAKSGGKVGLNRGKSGMGAVMKKRHKVDFTVLDCATLRRYVQVNGVESDEIEHAGKGALAECVSRHFSTTPLRGEVRDVLLRFIQAVRRK
eukprot:GFKZ01010167.1.p1 GENE.GFKZ01010167.1~~GFKZ01010167.1.p1  ORF type:complete len:436 (+),score=79.44 GFKZ01010167.1:441-1748(+)